MHCCIKEMSYYSSGFVDSTMFIYTSNSAAGFSPEITRGLKRHVHFFCHTTACNALSSKMVCLIETECISYGQKQMEMDRGRHTETTLLTDFCSSQDTHSNNRSQRGQSYFSNCWKCSSWTFNRKSF